MRSQELAGHGYVADDVDLVAIALMGQHVLYFCKSELT